MKGKSGLFAFLLLAALALGAFFGWRFYKSNYGSNVTKTSYVLIPQGAAYPAILDSVKGHVADLEAFKKVAEDKNLPKFFHPGRYRFAAGMGNSDLVNMIKAGNQAEDTFRIIDFGDVYQMVGRVSKKTELDSLRFVQDFNAIAREKGLADAEGLKKYFFIDTYQFFWTVTPRQFFGKFEEQYNAFWTPERQAKEKALGLTRDQVYALSSIVYKESGGKKDEMKTIAGLYLNRYRKGMKLQSDPTVIYAINKATNFTTPIKRVLYKHLTFSSPYNTYANAGIPPGPICIPEKNSVDAVLNPESHGYIFMAADPDRPGFHRFTASDAEHAKNARDYQNWLNSRNIK